MTQEYPLQHRLYFVPVYTEIARLVGYAGFHHRELEERLQPLLARFGRATVEAALWQVITLTFNGQEKRSGKQADAEVRLRPEVRKACWQLLGPPPEHPEYARYYPDRVKSRRGAKVPTKEEANESPLDTSATPEPSNKDQEKPLRDKDGNPLDQNLLDKTRKLNKRQLACMLRDARKRLAHNGKHSFVGKEAKKELAAAEYEYARRGLPLPAPGEEVPAKA